MHFAKSVQAERMVTEREAQRLEAQSREQLLLRVVHLFSTTAALTVCSQFCRENLYSVFST